MIAFQFKNRIDQIRMVEIGCGNGAVLRYLKSKNINIEGVDFSLNQLKYCSKLANVPLYQTDAVSTPFPDSHYNLIGVFDVIEHVENDQALIDELYRICQDNGSVLVTVPAHHFLWSYFDTLSEHKRRYTQKDLEAKLKKAGFEIVKISHFMFFLFPIIWLYRQLNMIPHRNKSPELEKLWELRTIPVLNNILLKILRQEKALLKHFNFPFGASLICLAKKSRNVPLGFHYK